jgi:iron complex outermembrane recepter protein
MQSNRRYRIFLLCCALNGTAVQAASSDDFLEMSLEELVDFRLMSMSRKEQRVADMAAAAYVVSAEEIRRSGAMSIPEALRLVPGLNVAQVGRNRWAVSARGINGRFSSKLLVQVDGRNIYSPTFSAVLWETQDVVMEDIERIEVIRGPGSALWGKNAMNGVINIVTRSAASSQGTLVSATAGSAEMSTLSMRQGGELDNGGYYKLDGKLSTTGVGSFERDSGQRGNDSTSQQRVSLRLEPELDHGQLRIQAQAYQNRSGDVWLMPSVLAYSDPGTPFVRNSILTSHDQGASLQARYAWRTGQGAENIIQAYVDHDSSNYSGLWGNGTQSVGPLAFAPSMQTIGGVKTDLDVDFQQRLTGAQHDFIWGVNLRYTKDNLLLPAGPYRLDQSTNSRVNYGAFVHDEWTLKPDRLKLILGSKFEQDALTGFIALPNARLLLTPNSKDTFWGGISRAALSPMRTSLATVDVTATDAATLNGITGLNLPRGVLTAVAQAAPSSVNNVQAEQSWSLEGGWRRQVTDSLSLDTALFVTDYSQLAGGRLLALQASQVLQALQCAANPANYTAMGQSRCYMLIPGRNSNEDKARAWGGEVLLEWNARPWWKLQASYSHLRFKGVRTGDVLGDLSLPAWENNTPRHQFYVNNHFRLAHDWYLNALLRANSSTKFYPINTAEPVTLSSYTGLDLRLGWQVNRQTELSLAVRDLLKARHTEFMGALPYTRSYDVQRSVLAQVVFRY